MEDDDKKKILEWCGCFKDKDRPYDQGWEVYTAPDGELVRFRSLQPDLNFYERYAFPKLLQDKMELKAFTFYDDLNDRTFWFMHIIDPSSGVVEAASVVGSPTLVEAVGIALLMYIEESSKKED